MSLCGLNGDPNVVRAEARTCELQMPIPERYRPTTTPTIYTKWTRHGSQTLHETITKESVGFLGSHSGTPEQDNEDLLRKIRGYELL